MEDGVTEAESLLLALNLNTKDEENASKFVAKDQVQEEPATDIGGGGGDDGGGEGGLINNLIFNLFHSTDRVGIIEDKKDGDKVPKLETPPAGPGAGGPGDADGEGEGAVINSHISNLFHPTEDDRIIQHKDDDEDKMPKLEKSHAAVDSGGGENVGGGEGGIINNLVSNLFHLAEDGRIIGNKNDDEDEIHKIETTPVAAGSGGGGGGENGRREGDGIINNLISNLFHSTENGGIGENEEDDKQKKVRIVEENQELKRDKVGNEGKGGIINNIASHLPTSLPDDAVPTSDEATILINSLVRD